MSLTSILKSLSQQVPNVAIRFISKVGKTIKLGFTDGTVVVDHTGGEFAVYLAKRRGQERR